MSLSITMCTSISSNFKPRNFAITQYWLSLRRPWSIWDLWKGSLITYMSLLLSYNFMDSQKELHFLNHKFKKSG